MPIQRYSLSEIQKRLSHYDCRKLVDVAPGFELWETGWKEPFSLAPQDGYYDDFQYRKVLLLISKTMPPGWTLNSK